ncbi:serine protease [Euzebya pacifica]|uniref:Serine protease n=1 Tax=Euzebya pacifica TaxID=1608957 RepID=A0A346Y0C1_9ACTN|nr:S1C family serine protease [Euzebya pacifica]AXV07918.1 serine protease [Euzebya pacifica]
MSVPTIDITTLADRVAAGTVGIRARGRRGTAVVLPDNQLLTTAHNVRGDRVEVLLDSGVRLPARVLGVAEDLDLAVLAVADHAGQDHAGQDHAGQDHAGANSAGTDRAGIDRTPLSWAPADAVPSVGAAVAAAAAPDGVVRVTAGSVSTSRARLRTATGSPLADLLEHTAPLPRGASGGPVVDGEGRLVGMDVNRIEGGLYQAVRADDVLRGIIGQLAQGEVPRPRRLGVQVVPRRRAAWLRAAVGLDPAEGVLLAGVDPEGPAAVAGLDRGDLLTALDGAALHGPDDLLLALRNAGEQLQLIAVRGADAPRTIDVDTRALTN